MTRKNNFFEGWSWLKFNNLELALGMALKFCTRVAKGLKRKVCGLMWGGWGGGGGGACLTMSLDISEFLFFGSSKEASNDVTTFLNLRFITKQKPALFWENIAC